ncbi:MAG: helix-turn-helix transcriptional regulator [Clostridia bacterium]|nr:helix-turn-helix transcriptional regulator [Clostridia bacterium]
MEFKLKRFEKAIEVTRIANIHYFEFINRYRTVKDNHTFRELVYVDTGVINIDAEGFSGLLGENMMIIHKSGEIHSLSCTDDTAPNVIIIGFECTSPELDAFSQSPVLLNSEQQRTLTEVIKEGRTVFKPPYDIPNLKDMKKRKDYPFGADQMIKLKLEILLIDLIRSRKTSDIGTQNDTDDPKMYEIHSYIKKNFKENITLGELCFLFGTNKTTLCSAFKNAYGDTVIGYINKLKIKEAKRLMREGNYNLTEISSILRFSSLHYFSRMFKKQERISPSEYIRTIKSRLDI